MNAHAQAHASGINVGRGGGMRTRNLVPAIRKVPAKLSKGG